MSQPARPSQSSRPSAFLEEIEIARKECWTPQRVLEWGLDSFAPQISLSASFGSAEGMVILDMMTKIDRSRTRVFTIDTGRLPQPTYNLIDRVRDRYQVEVEVFFPDPKRVEDMVRSRGMNLFYESVENRRLCCGIRKVEPLARALDGLEAWISGLRQDQSAERAEADLIEVDSVHGDRIKLNPLVRWSKDEVWSYVRENSVPVNALHAQGYPSVGCAPCTRAIQKGEDERAGRWWWEQETNRECGIHTGYETEGSGI